MQAKQVKGEDAEELILKYLNQNYKPFAINDIIQNLHGAVSKTNAIKALEKLAMEGKIQYKTFGKINIYLRNEVELEHKSVSCEYNFETIQELRDEVARLKSETKDWKCKLDSLLNELTNTELDSTVLEVSQELQILERTMTTQKQENTSTDQKTIDWLQKERAKLDRELRQRKRSLKSCIQLLKQTIQPQNCNDFLEEIGCDLQYV